MGIKFFVSGLLFLLMALRLGLNDAVIFKFTNAVCVNHNESWISLHLCRLRAISRNRNTFNLNLSLNYPVSYVTVKIQVFKKANGYKPWFFATSIDGCRFLKRPYNPVAIIVFKLFKEFSNLNHTCPYSSGPIIIKGFYLRHQILPNGMPTVERDVVVVGQLFKRANGYKPWLYKVSLDACQFVKKPYNPIAIIVYKMFKQYSNLNHSCPYKGIILVQKLTLRLDTLPHAIPTGDYLLQLDWLISKKLQFVTKAYFKFIEDL
ncbi:uncharacterized protein Dmoj_GI20048 [Drosophila mojavensis]|uniref:Uncharacterized protein n=1 Tax=Drosophila mojavensis TaxID=7230 RepID=B4KU06_DROMO|nr:uncharacterized protein Dmoj_GI20048 [Drosophila mojavensis]